MLEVERTEFHDFEDPGRPRWAGPQEDDRDYQRRAREQPPHRMTHEERQRRIQEDLREIERLRAEDSQSEDARRSEDPEAAGSRTRGVGLRDKGALSRERHEQKQ